MKQMKSWNKLIQSIHCNYLFQDDKPIKSNDRLKVLSKPDDKDKEGTQFLLEITAPQKSDEAKYKCVVKNAEGQNQQSLNLVFDWIFPFSSIRWIVDILQQNKINFFRVYQVRNLGKVKSGNLDFISSRISSFQIELIFLLYGS